MEQLPNYLDIFKPILEILSDGQVLTAKKIKRRVNEELLFRVTTLSIEKEG